MITGTKYVSVYQIIGKVYRDMGMSDSLNISDAIEWAAEAIELIGASLSYEEKVEVITVTSYKAKLPCELHYLETAGAFPSDDTTTCPENCSFTQMRYSTDSYHHAICANNKDCGCTSSLTYKVNQDYMFTNFENGFIRLAYKAIPVDCDGFPTIPDDIKFKQAVSYHIQERLGFIKLMSNKISDRAYQIITQNRDWYMGAANTRANMPSVDMMESIKNNWIRLIPKINQHSDGFKSMGEQEQRYTHNSFNSSAIGSTSDPSATFFNSTQSKPVSMTGDQAVLFTPNSNVLIYITVVNATFTQLGYYSYSTTTNSWTKL